MYKLTQKTRYLRNIFQNICTLRKGVHYTSDVKISSSISLDIKVAKYAYIGNSCSICSKVSVGNYSMIASNVAIIGKGHNYNINNVPMIYSGRPNHESTSIGNDVWIGYGAILIAGITIGDGSIIAAGSVVTKSIPPFSIYAGNPARKIKDRFEDPKIHFSHQKMIRSAKIERLPPSRQF